MPRAGVRGSRKDAAEVLGHAGPGLLCPWAGPATVPGCFRGLTLQSLELEVDN